METYLLLQSILANMSRHEQLDGVDHMVIPVVAVKEGVLNGFLYPAEEIKRFASSWNGSPVSVNHPILNGKDASANMPRFESTINIGKVFNSHFEDNSLKSEIWINTEKAKRLGYEPILNRLKSGEMMEVSTGLNALIDRTPGDHKGKAYNAIVKSIMPDHLALLPNDVGACSIADGCGALRNNAKESPCGCNKCTGDHSVETNSKPESKKDGGILNKMVTEFARLITNKIEKVKPMNKDELIALLINNKTSQFTEADKPLLNGFDVAALTKMVPVEDKTPVANADEEKVKADKVEADKVAQAAKDVANKTETFSAEDRIMFNRMKDEKLVQLANMRVAVEKAHNHLSKDDVASFSIEVLEKMAANIQPVANYSIAGAASNSETTPYKRESIIMNKCFDKKESGVDAMQKEMV